MATVLEGDVKKNLLERTEAEKVFRPWWDTLEDCLLNTLIVIGELIILLLLLRVGGLRVIQHVSSHILKLSCCA